MINPANINLGFYYLTTLEKGLNFVGYIPLAGTFSSYVRGTYAGVECITGIALGILGIGLNMQGNEAAGTCFKFAAVLIGHSVLNGIRGVFEWVPGVALCTTLPYDLYATYVLGKLLFPYPTV